mmetsp:Transcript_35298/g.82410  ORF Transcript_35298/g.82410 Transcript_35298/m.82410 type:complete len:362 (-) Transcript_35298:62-1147(-)
MASFLMIETGLVILSWFVLNISMGSLTKWTYLFGKVCAMTGEGMDCDSYKFPLAITVIHMIFSWGFCGIYLKFSSKEKGPAWSFDKQLRKIAPLAATFAFSVAMGNLSLKYIFPSFNQMLGSMSPIITVAIAVIFMGKRYNKWTWISMPIICGGLVICSVDEVNFNALGAFYATGATVLRSVKSLMQNKLLVDPADKLDSVTLLYYMAPFAGAILGVASLILEGIEPITIFFPDSWEGNPVPTTGIERLFGLLTMSGLNACFLNIANFLVTSYTNALTLQVLGNVKACLAIAISVAIFGNELLVAQGVGVFICLFGVWVYQNKGGAAEKPQPKPSPAANNAQSMELGATSYNPTKGAGSTS